MKTRIILLFFCFASICHSVSAQFSCGFDAIHQRLLSTDIPFQQQQREMETQLQQAISRLNETQKFSILSTNAAIYHIPVVVHVIHTGGAVGTIYNPSDADINGAINYLNQVFDGTWTGSGGSIMGAGDIQIKFVLATKDPLNNPSTGINRVNGSAITNYTSTGISTGDQNQERAIKNLVRWDPFKYYNIWIVNKIDGSDGTSGSFIAGYAYFPMGNTSANNINLDGTVMLATQMRAGQKTLPHEIGHAFNLYHVFQGETVAAGQNGCGGNTTTTGDRCVDTDPITDPTDDFEVSPFACRTGINHCTGTAYNDNTERNFMNYTSCYRLFTNDQKARMLATASATMRASIATSWANDQGLYPISFSAPSAPAITPSSSLVTANVAGIMNLELNGRKVYSLNASQDGGYKDGADKWYQLFHLQPATNYILTVTPLGLNQEQIGVFIDYNNDGSFTGANETIGIANLIPAGSGVAFNFTTPGVLPGNIARLRIIEDLATIYGVPPISATSATLTYGQAEDYPVFLQGSVLPVTLTSFDGNRVQNNIQLKWETLNEINMDKYVVERSTNQQPFLPITELHAKNDNSAYNYTDRSLSNATYSYRLKMMNRDGSFNHSKTIHFNIDLATSLEIISNPFQQNIRIKMPAHTGPVHFRLLDVTGKTLLKETIRSNDDLITIDTDNLKLLPGIYILETLLDGKIFTNKVLKQ